MRPPIDKEPRLRRTAVYGNHSQIIESITVNHVVKLPVANVFNSTANQERQKQRYQPWELPHEFNRSPGINSVLMPHAVANWQVKDRALPVVAWTNTYFIIRFPMQRYKNICIVKIGPLRTRILLSGHKIPMTRDLGTCQGRRFSLRVLE